MIGSGCSIKVAVRGTLRDEQLAQTSADHTSSREGVYIKETWAAHTWLDVVPALTILAVVYLLMLRLS